MVKKLPELSLRCFTFSIFFPSISIINIGKSTSIQVSVVFAILLLSLYSYRGKITFSTSQLIWFLTLVLLITLQYYSLSLQYTNLDKYEKALFNLPIVFLFIVLGYIISRNNDIDIFWSTYKTAAVFHSIWALFQFVFWSILNRDIPFLVGYHNTNSFALWANVVDYVHTGRSFSFTPEPSLLFLLLAPALLVSVHLKTHLSTIIIFLGILTTKSFGTATVIPFSLLFLYYISSCNRNTKQILIFIFSVLVGIFIYIFNNMNTDVSNIVYTTNVVSRITQFYLDPSFLSRFSSISIGVGIIHNNPFFGLGLQSDMLLDELAKGSTALEILSGITSFIISMLCWFGWPITLIFLLPTIRHIFDIRFSLLSRIAIFTVFFGACISLNYYNFYIIWIVIGMTLISLPVFFGKSSCNAENHKFGLRGRVATREKCDLH